MGIASSLSRFTDYYKRHGLVATVRRAGLATKRVLFSNRIVLFYCDLTRQEMVPANAPASLKTERLKAYAELSQTDLECMTSFWNPEQAQANIRERFGRGASLWLVKTGEELAGYGWTLQGDTIEPHYFPLAQDDVHLFDFHVLPGYRGRGINPFLVNSILHRMAGECAGRGFIEAAEWNRAQLSSLRKTPFKRMGWARKSAISRSTIVRWAQSESVVPKDAKLRDAPRQWQGRMGSEAPGGDFAPQDQLKLHHIGFVVRSIEESAESFARSLGATWDGNVTFDPIQKVHVTFFRGHNPTDPMIELVEPGEAESPVSQFLKDKGGLHHLCYEVGDMESHLEFCKSVGTIIIRPPVPAVAFGGRRIAWVVTRKRLLVEFLECSHPAN